MTLESDITKGILKALNAIEGVRAVKVHASQMGNGGEPDIDVVAHGRSIKLEVKQPGKTPTPRQLSILRKWRSAGAAVAVVTSTAEALDILERVTRGDNLPPLPNDEPG